MIIPFLSEPPKLYAIEVHVILLCLKELVVEVNVVFTSLRKLTRGQQQFDEQLVQFLGRDSGTINDIGAQCCAPMV